jgi:membrane protein YdbS with pleckstrin-like domain
MSLQINRFETQGPDEKILMILRAHPLVNLGWIISGIFCILLPLIILIAFSLIGFHFQTFLSGGSIVSLILVWYLVVTSFSFQQFLLWFFNIYVITNKRIVDIEFYHLFYKQISETPLENVQDITNREVGMIQNWFDFGELAIQTAGETENFECPNINNPDAAQQKILDLVAVRKQEIFGSAKVSDGTT